MSSVGMENLSLKYSGCEILGYSVSTNVLLNSGVKSSDVMYVCHDKKTVCAIIVLCNGNSFSTSNVLYKDVQSSDRTVYYVIVPGGCECLQNTHLTALDKMTAHHFTNIRHHLEYRQ